MVQRVSEALKAEISSAAVLIKIGENSANRSPDGHSLNAETHLLRAARRNDDFIEQHVPGNCGHHWSDITLWDIAISSPDSQQENWG